MHSIALGRIDKVRQDHVKGRFFSFRDEFNAYLGSVKKQMGGNETGYVYIVNYTYVGGSAVDEKSLKDRDSGPDYDETTADGTDLDKCSANWTDLLIAPDFLQPIQEGKIKSYFKLGPHNCIKQGQVVELKDSLGETSPVLAKVKVRKVKRFKVAHLAAQYFDLVGYDFKTLHDFIAQSVKQRPAEYMTVVDFDLVNSETNLKLSSRACPLAIYLSRPLDEGADSSITVSVAAARCALPGSLTKVLVVSENGYTSKILVRVKARTESPHSPTVSLILQRLDQPVEVAL